MTRFNPLNEYGRVEMEIHAFLAWTVELKETPPPLSFIIGQGKPCAVTTVRNLRDTVEFRFW
jgi:hypothetical protein